jgi:hypothetical protein
LVIIGNMIIYNQKRIGGPPYVVTKADGTPGGFEPFHLHASVKTSIMRRAKAVALCRRDGLGEARLRY